jgi:ATP-dependent Clp protease ATP-binding subunit ClpA
VVDKFLIELENQLLEKGISVTVSDELREWICTNGYDPKYGARPIQRFIQDKIKRPLVDEVLFGKLEKGGHVNFTLQDGKISFGFEEKRHVQDPKSEKLPSTEKVSKD